MKRWWLCVAVLVLLIGLGGMAVLLDSSRAGVRITTGFESLLESSREATLLASEDNEPGSAQRESLSAVARTQAVELVVHVVRAEGEPVKWADVLAYRGKELVRAGRTDANGTASLLPFSGSGFLAVVSGSEEVARRECSRGSGRWEVVVPRGRSVAGIVLVDGVPRTNIYLELVTGPEEGWVGRVVREELERVGWRERVSRRSTRSEDDGRFRFDWLRADWSGGLRPSDAEYYRFADGSKRLELEGPEEGLVIELHERRPELTLHGRVVFHGEPVPHARCRASMRGETNFSFSTTPCDEAGRFFFFAPQAEVESIRLDFLQPGVGVRSVERRGTEALGDFGDVELTPERRLPFVVTSSSGEPIAGARALVPSSHGPHECHLLPEANLFFASEPTDAAGRSELACLLPDQSQIRVGAPGFSTQVVAVPEILLPLTITLTRTSALEVVLRDLQGSAPPGLEVQLTSLATPLTWAGPYHPSADELALGASNPSGARLVQNGLSVRFRPDESGRLSIHDLRDGVPFDLEALDPYGTSVASARNLTLEPGEWRVLVLTVTAQPRTLIATLHDSLGTPVPGAWLSVTPLDGLDLHSNSLRSDRAGMLRVPFLYSSLVKLDLRREGFEWRTLESLTIPPEGTTLEIGLARDWWPW